MKERRMMERLPKVKRRMSPKRNMRKNHRNRKSNMTRRRKRSSMKPLMLASVTKRPRKL